MATRKSSIGANLVIDRRQFKAALDASRNDATKFARNLEAIRQPRSGLLSGEGMTGWRNGVSQVIGKYQHLRQAVTDVTALAVRTAGAPAMLNDMKDALTAVTGSAEEAKTALDFIAGVAEEQKLEFEPLVQAYEHMRALGYSADQTSGFIRERGNAIETAGKGTDELTEIVTALVKMEDAGDQTARVLGRMGQNMPFLRKIMEEQFGANTGAEIDALGLSMEELFDGIVRGLRRVETNAGGWLDSMSPEYIASMNRLRAGRAGMGDSPIVPSLPGRTPEAADPAADAAQRDALRQRAEARKAAKAAAAQAKKDAATEAADLKKRQEENREAEEREAAQKDFAATAREDMEVARLRAGGKTKKADKLEGDIAERRRVQQLIDQGGLSETDAKAMASGERQITEDTAHLERTGRRRIKGAISPNNPTGIPDTPDAALKDEWSFPALAEAREFRGRKSEPNLDRRTRDQLGVTPDKFSGMTLKQAEEMIEQLRYIRSATEKNQPSVSTRTAPRT
jgi:hypothetical protein